MSRARKPSPKTLPGHGSHPVPDEHHTCLRCPMCASETCRTLQDLGMYCETQVAATEARAGGKEREPRSAA